MVRGVSHSFSGLAGQTVYLKVEVYANDYSDPQTEYVSRISANSHVLSTNCSPGEDQGHDFFVCLFDVDVSSLIDARTGTLEIQVVATKEVNSYPYKGKLLYVRLSAYSLMLPTTLPTSAPSSQPTALPSGLPTTQPSSEPTSLPSSLPTTLPTTVPSTLPSGDPTSIPSMEPTGQPTNTPTYGPTSSVPSIVPSFTETAPYVWIGDAYGSDWHSWRNWNRRAPPGSGSTVVIHLLHNQSVQVSENVTVATLTLQGDGMIEFVSPGVTIIVTDYFNYVGGGISSKYNGCGIVFQQRASLIHSELRFLRNVTLWNYGIMEWTGGDLVLANSLIHNTKNGTFYIHTEGEISLREASSWYGYQRFDTQVLNVEVDLDMVLPPIGAVYDLVIPDGTTSHNVNTSHFWPLQVSTSKGAAYYYAHSVGYPRNYSVEMYNLTLSSIDVDTCAEACSAVDWCKSFDYLLHTASCLLSYFGAHELGGLSTSSSFQTMSFHFERIPSRHKKLSPSSITNEGILTVGEGTACTLEASLNLLGDSVLQLGFGSSVVVRRGGNASALSSLQLCNASLHIESSTFTFDPTTTIENDCIESNSSLVYSGGSHISSANLDSVELSITGNASVAMPQLPLHTYSSFYITSGTLVIAGNNTITLPSLTIKDGGRVDVSSLYVTTEDLFIGEGSVLSASGEGPPAGGGKAPGSDNEYAASGGAYGGRGGSTHIDAPSEPYGSSTWPVFAGSGGGLSAYDSGAGGGGGGGGVIVILATSLVINGDISCEGSRGLSGGGGGSGGSIAVNASVVRGMGSISVRGGDGGYSGGLVSGGAGSGGRIAIHTVDLLFNGTLDASGGYRHTPPPSRHSPPPELAGAGSIFFLFRNNAPEISRTLVVSSVPLTGVLNHLIENTMMPSEGILSDTQTAVRREAYIFESSGDFGGSINLHVVGRAAVRFRSTSNPHSINVSMILGSSPPGEMSNVYFDQHTVLSVLTHVHIENMELHIYNTTFDESTTVIIEANGCLSLYNFHSDSIYYFYDLVINNDGWLRLRNESITVTGSFLQTNTGSSIEICAVDAALDFTSFNLSNGTVYGREGWECAEIGQREIGNVPLLTISTMRIVSAWFIVDVTVNVLDSLDLLDVDINLNSLSILTAFGVVTCSGRVTVNRDDMVTVPYNSLLFSCANPSDGYLANVPTALLIIGPSCTLLIAAEATTIINVYVDIDGEIDVAGAIAFTAGGTCGEQCVIHSIHTGNITLAGGVLFTLENALMPFRGNGAVTLEGIVRSPTMLNATPAISVKDGCLLMDVHDNYTIKVLRVNGAGGAHISGRTLIDTLHLENGTVIATDVTVLQSFNIVGGVLSGTGSMTISEGAVMNMQPPIATGAANVTILEVDINNRGTILVNTGATYFGRGGGINNFGVLNFVSAGHHEWLQAPFVNCFVKRLESTFTDWEGVWNIDGVTAEHCACECVTKQWPVERRGAGALRFKYFYPCRGFSYNSFLKSCRIHITVPDDLQISSDSSRGDYSWDFYIKKTEWSRNTTLVNHASGTINISQSSASAFIEIGVDNYGSILVPATRALTITGQLNHTRSAIADIAGSILIGHGGSFIAGSITGGGGINLSGGSRHILLEETAWTNVTLTVSASATLLLNRSVMNFVGSRLVIDGGNVVFATPVVLSFSEVIITNNGSLRSEIGTVMSDTSGFECGRSICGDAVLNVSSLILTSNGSIDVSFSLIRADNLTVADTATLSCKGRGYSLATATARRGWAGSYGLLGSLGGSHGGVGGSGYTTQTHAAVDVYGSYHAPSTWGAPGGASDESVLTTAGGGAIQIVAVHLVVNGIIDCGGLSPTGTLSGGGAGGSLAITTGTFSGDGIVVARGGAGGSELHNTFARAGGGGGGRIAISYKDVTGFSGYVSASGGEGHQAGSAGTVFWNHIDVNDYDAGGRLIYSNDGLETSINSHLHIESSPFVSLQSISVIEGSRLVIGTEGKTLYVHELVGDHTGRVIAANRTVLSGNFSSNGLFSLNNITLTILDATLASDRVRVGNNAQLILSELGQTSFSTPGNYNYSSLDVMSGGTVSTEYVDVALCDGSTAVITITAINITVCSGGKISSDGNGYAAVSSVDSSQATSGSGYGHFATAGGGGGGHGGYGGAGYGAGGGSPYGSFTSPRHCGSGGSNASPGSWGGRGGGVVTLVASTLTVDGVISADGSSAHGHPGGGGGSGGSVMIYTRYLLGAGVIRAEGGQGTYSLTAFGGGGGGGRVALVVNSYLTEFAGQVTAQGGTSYPVTGVSNTFPYNINVGTDILEWLTSNATAAACGTVYQDTNFHSSKVLIVEDIGTFEFALEYVANVIVDIVGTPMDTSYFAAYNYSYETLSFSLDRSQTEISASDSPNINRIELLGSSKLVVRNGTDIRIMDELYCVVNGTFSVERDATVSFHNSSCAISRCHMHVMGTVMSATSVELSQGSALHLYSNATWVELDTLWPDDATGLFNVSHLVIYDSAGIVLVGDNDRATPPDSFVRLHTTTLALLDTNSFISSDVQGYSGASVGNDVMSRSAFQAMGNVTYGDGGWHAGSGGTFSAGGTYAGYGSAYQPVRSGGGGGSTYALSGGRGGGVVRIMARDELVVNGRISANGESCAADVVGSGPGAGAGGSVWITLAAGAMQGSGYISALGGNGCTGGGGGGSGGRVAVFDAVRMISFNGTISVHGGTQEDRFFPSSGSSGATRPAGGTIFIAFPDATSGILMSSNAGRSGADIVPSGYDQSVHEASGYMESIVVDMGSSLSFAVPCRIIADRLESIATVAPYLHHLINYSASLQEFGVLGVKGGSELFLKGDLVLNHFHMDLEAATLNIYGNVTIAADSELRVEWNRSSIGILDSSLFTFLPTSTPSSAPSDLPSGMPTGLPSLSPAPSAMPSSLPSGDPSSEPSTQPSSCPTISFAPSPSLVVTSIPSSLPSSSPLYPSKQPSLHPVRNPSSVPSSSPSISPPPTTSTPSIFTSAPSSLPSGLPTTLTNVPSNKPVCCPSKNPTMLPTIKYPEHSGEMRFRNMDILSGGTFRIKPVDELFPSSLVISADFLAVEAGGAIIGDAVVRPRTSSWSGSAGRDRSSAFASYGRASNGRTGGAGGGHAGAGTGGFNNDFPGGYRGYGSRPLGAGGPGGSGPHGPGGKGGAGIRLTVYKDFDFNGTVSVNGESAAWSSGAGGGAGGSVFIEVFGRITGQGMVLANGGHGAASSSMFGGGGAAGRIKVASCLSEFSGYFNAYGGLSLQAIPSYNISAGAAGTIYQTSVGCSDPDKHFTKLLVTSWDPVNVHANDTSLSYLMNVIANSTLTSATASIVTFTTVFDIFGTSDDYKNESTFNSVEVRNSEAALLFSGTSTGFIGDLLGSPGTSFSFDEMVRFQPVANMVVDNFTVYMYGDIVHDSLCRDVTVRNGGRLYLGPQATYIVDNVSVPVICFNDVFLHNGMIEGPSVNLTVTSLRLEGKSAISADGLGHKGAEVGGSAGNGPGAGEGGDTGGSGGGYGSEGLPGINAYYRQQASYQLLGSGGESMSIDSYSGSGPVYGFAWTVPSESGSGGGSSTASTGRGGNGGGIVWIDVDGNIDMSMDSRISANGESVFGGGGGGSGGSVYLRSRFINGHGDVTANGGLTCRNSSCPLTIDHPGGAGGAGRVYVDANAHNHAGVVEAMAGGMRDSKDNNRMSQSYMGSVRQQRPAVAMVYGSDEGGEYIDIIRTVDSLLVPIYRIEVMSQSGAAVIGHFVLSYRSQLTDVLSVSTTAAVMQVAIQNLTSQVEVSVNRGMSASGGRYYWDVTFHRYHGEVSELKISLRNKILAAVDSSRVSSSLYIMERGETAYESSAPATYCGLDISSTFSLAFSVNIINTTSVAYWTDRLTIRLYPNYVTSLADSLVGTLQLQSFRPVPSKYGVILGIYRPTLLDYFDSYFGAPTSVPSGTPSGEPTSLPSGEPSGLPTSAPSGEPSSIPSAIPTSPTSVPSGAPSGEPSGDPTGQPTTVPTSLPSGEPSSQPTSVPSGEPSSQPSSEPTGEPTTLPSSLPSGEPTGQPTSNPSGQPSGAPTNVPSSQPTSLPTSEPSGEPTGVPSTLPSSLPSGEPTGQPTSIPSGQPSGAPTNVPSSQPTSLPTSAPSGEPSGKPTTLPSSLPSSVPSGRPTGSPSGAPSSLPSGAPTGSPTDEPTSCPSSVPSCLPTNIPSGEPSALPSSIPSGAPTTTPSCSPTAVPTEVPTSVPSGEPTSLPSAFPTSPSSYPSGEPSVIPSSLPTSAPSCNPTDLPSSLPSQIPTCIPTALPSAAPSSQPSNEPSSSPSGRPTTCPSAIPTGKPSGCPSGTPTNCPSGEPSTIPSGAPTLLPSSIPTGQPSSYPSSIPSSAPSALPTTQPSSTPSSHPSSVPSGEPSGGPTGVPSCGPSAAPSAAPSSLPTGFPSSKPSGEPSSDPSGEPSSPPSSAPSGEPSSLPSGVPSCNPSAKPSCFPSAEPSCVPSSAPSSGPTIAPSGEPSGEPSGVPSGEPSGAPSGEPSSLPSSSPSGDPSGSPTGTPSSGPTATPSGVPSGAPSLGPSGEPSGVPSGEPSSLPSSSPSGEPSGSPTQAPSSGPTATPSGAPSGVPSVEPSCIPSSFPSGDPSGNPTGAPSCLPTSAPSGVPSALPSLIPSGEPTCDPTSVPSGEPSCTPTNSPTSDPSGSPTGTPSSNPTGIPSCEPSGFPSGEPSSSPSSAPSGEPSGNPTGSPSSGPTVIPSGEPSGEPSGIPSGEPSAHPTSSPSAKPSSIPTGSPSSGPTTVPSGEPSGVPSLIPTCEPSCLPSSSPSGEPSSIPSGAPSSDPTVAPSGEPSGVPSGEPSSRPSSSPSGEPSSSPTEAPSSNPTAIPSGEPSSLPSGDPSGEPSSPPSSVPSGEPSGNPTGSPSSGPTVIPSGEPSSLPSGFPSGEPSCAPSGEPSCIPSSAPSCVPSSTPPA